MSEIKIYVEGGGDSKELKTRCREAITKLLEKSDFIGRPPRIVACGSRNEAFDDFKTAYGKGKLVYVALLVDSEDPVKAIKQTWEHLNIRDKWTCPADAADDQVFLMTTCMETWIIADRAALNQHYKNCLQISALPSTTNIERKARHSVQDSLTNATQKCTNAYAKNKRSFEALANVNPDELTKHCPSFTRMIRILNEKL